MYLSQIVTNFKFQHTRLTYRIELFIIKVNQKCFGFYSDRHDDVQPKQNKKFFQNYITKVFGSYHSMY